MESPFKCYSFDLGEDSSLHLVTSGNSGSSSTTDTDLYEDDHDTVDPGPSVNPHTETGDETFYYSEKKIKKDKKRIKTKKKLNDRKGSVKSVCRISHLDRSSLSHLKDPYTHLPGVTTYEKDTCFNVRVTCGKDQMRANFNLNKAFTGRVYSMRAANTCSQSLDATSSFSLTVPFFPSSSPYWDTVSNNQHNNFKKANVDCGVTVSTVSGGPKRKSKRDHLNPHAYHKLPHQLNNNNNQPQVLRNVHSGHMSHRNHTSPVDVPPSALQDLGEGITRAAVSEDKKLTDAPLIPAKVEPVENPNHGVSSSRGTKEFARFSVSLVLQRHALIVTSSDLDLTLNCDFDLSQQRIVSNSIQLVSSHDIPYEDYVHAASAGDITSAEKKKPPHHPSNVPPFPSPIPILPSLFPPVASPSAPSSSPSSHVTSSQHQPPAPGSTGVGSVSPGGHGPVSQGSGQPNQGSNILTTHEATFHSPIVKMGITDRDGGPVRAAEVGDPLSLRFELQSTEDGRESLYEIFVKNIFADDGVDTVSIFRQVTWGMS